MRIPLSILFVLLAIVSFGQSYSDSGFTNKAEAKNLMVNGQKQGKWIVYVDSNNVVVTNKRKAVAYKLIVFEDEKPQSGTMIYEYTLDDKLKWKIYPKDEAPKHAIIDKRWPDIRLAPKPDLSVSAKVDSMLSISEEIHPIYMDNVDSELVRTKIYLTATVVNNSSDIVVSVSSASIWSGVLFSTNNDFVNIPYKGLIMSQKTRLYFDTLYPHKPFVVQLIKLGVKAPAKYKSKVFKVGFTLEDIMKGQDSTYVYWSDNIEIK